MRRILCLFTFKKRTTIPPGKGSMVQLPCIGFYHALLSHLLGVAIAIYFHRNVPKQMFLYILDLQTPDIIDFLYLDQSPCYNPTHVEWNVSLAPLPPHVSVQNDGPRDEAQGPGWKKDGEINGFRKQYSKPAPTMDIHHRHWERGLHGTKYTIEYN